MCVITLSLRSFILPCRHTISFGWDISSDWRHPKLFFTQKKNVPEPICDGMLQMLSLFIANLFKGYCIQSKMLLWFMVSFLWYIRMYHGNKRETEAEQKGKCCDIVFVGWMKYRQFYFDNIFYCNFLIICLWFLNFFLHSYNVFLCKLDFFKESYIFQENLIWFEKLSEVNLFSRTAFSLLTLSFTFCIFLKWIPISYQNSTSRNNRQIEVRIHFHPYRKYVLLNLSRCIENRVNDIYIHLRQIFVTFINTLWVHQTMLCLAGVLNLHLNKRQNNDKYSVILSTHANPFKVYSPI